MSGASVKSCVCAGIKNSPAKLYQDRKYGSGKTVHNKRSNQAPDREMYRCTVCGNKRPE